MIHFLSNHKDTSPLEAITGEDVTLIPHPYIEPEWTTAEVGDKCHQVIARAIRAEKLVANGDYTLVSMIVLIRATMGKQTGFLCMRKLNEPTAARDPDGNIVHRNVLRPVGVRYV